MYRSASWNRGTEDYSSAPPKGLWMGSMIGPLDEDEQPSYNNPPEEMVKKEKSRAKFAENAIHIIPFVLFACALVLWLFSNPSMLTHKYITHRISESKACMRIVRDMLVLHQLSVRSYICFLLHNLDLRR